MLKAIDVEAAVSVIYMHDTAIDESKSDLTKYLEEAYFTKPQDWKKHITLRDGQQITEFVIGVLPANLLARIEDDANFNVPDLPVKHNSLNLQCFLNGIRDIKHGPVGEYKDARGKTVQGVPKVMRNGVEYVDAAWLEETFCGALYRVAQQIGGVIHRWQSMCGADAKN